MPRRRLVQVSEEHEAAKAAARRETQQQGTHLPLNRRMELRDDIWVTADAAERAALRAEYALAGWTLCPHSGCPPYDCRPGPNVGTSDVTGPV